jgi:heterodisulfide reductase subunit C/nitrate reductase gamma subunit
MVKQIIFISTMVITIGVFLFTAYRLYRFYKLTNPYKFGKWGKRFTVLLDVAFFQSKIFRRPIIGLMHALVFWGFCVILVGSIEMIIDGVFGTERIFSAWGKFYNIITASGDIFGLLVLIAIVVFLIRRLFLKIKRFHGVEMKKVSHQDANVALTLILLLMVSLLGMNVFYITSCKGNGVGFFPVSSYIANWIGIGEEDKFLYEFFWWMHILLIFVFANILPYSKHFHVFMSIPNVFLSRQEPLGKLPVMECVLNEVKMMMNPETAFAAPTGTDQEPICFGVKDAEDVNRKNYLDALTCTECGRCTSVCPANITGKKLSPRKIFMDLRARMKEKGPHLLKEGKDYTDNRSLVGDYITTEELWACTTCNACAQECPVNINHPTLIIDMRRYQVMELGNAPTGIKSIFANIENNGAPWQFSPEDRMKWAD